MKSTFASPRTAASLRAPWTACSERSIPTNRLPGNRPANAVADPNSANDSAAITVSVAPGGNEGTRKPRE